ncbi:hypothetical protein L211DRAFT_853532 [Terfezia boudieri ATCC MYA-4762]|uniref:Hypervirulence associated protein TUDOR domain-containing protein n=1 Tax=Terfezia boudieri ATCC MYA-4762 TaxID=1051890 RepID=A0A3N4LEG3_9PEZI|nr:hypothetical protein L211DRAFT_853532 [Terfezia boudieri ATCC MYA-4762]
MDKSVIQTVLRILLRLLLLPMETTTLTQPSTRRLVIPILPLHPSVSNQTIHGNEKDLSLHVRHRNKMDNTFIVQKEIRPKTDPNPLRDHRTTPLSHKNVVTIQEGTVMETKESQKITEDERG